MRLLDFGYRYAFFEKDGRGQHQDRAVDDQRAVQRDAGIDQIEAAGFAFFLAGFPDPPGLHQRRMQIEIVRHHRRADDGDGDVQALIVQPRQQPRHDFMDHRPRKRQLDQEASGDHRDQDQDHRFDQADSVAGKPQHQDGVERGDQHPDQQRQSEQQAQRDGRAQHLRQIARGDRDFAQHP